MTRQAKKSASKQTGTRKPNILESITGADALAILKVLAARNERMAREIDAVARQLFSHGEIDEMAANVQMELEFLNVEDVWDRAGAKRDECVARRRFSRGRVLRSARARESSRNAGCA